MLKTSHCKHRDLGKTLCICKYCVSYSVFYLLRHCSQNRKSGLCDIVRCSALRMDSPPELLLVTGSSNKSGHNLPRKMDEVSSSTQMKALQRVWAQKGYTLSWPGSISLSRRSCRAASQQQQRAGWCFLSALHGTAYKRQWRTFSQLHMYSTTMRAWTQHICWRFRKHTLSSFHSPAAHCMSGRCL